MRLLYANISPSSTANLTTVPTTTVTYISTATATAPATVTSTHSDTALNFCCSTRRVLNRRAQGIKLKIIPKHDIL